MSDKEKNLELFIIIINKNYVNLFSSCIYQDNSPRNFLNLKMKLQLKGNINNCFATQEG